MSRKNESNQKAALRSAFGQFLRENDVTIKHSDDVNSIMKDMISLVLEGALDEEMDEHLGYSKYDYEGKYAVVYMDAIHFHVRSEGRIIKKSVYIALGIDLEGHKDVLGMYVGENESAKFWLSILGQKDGLHLRPTSSIPKR